MLIAHRTVRGPLALAALTLTSLSAHGLQAPPGLIKDIEAQPVGFVGSSQPVLLATNGQEVLLRAHNGHIGAEPWLSDGTDAGTFILADLVPGSAGSQPEDALALSNGNWAFVATAAAGQELYVSDGTEAGTQLARDIWPGPSGSAPRQLVEFQGEIWFVAEDGANGAELWRSDGSLAGTQLAFDLEPGPGSFFSNGSLVRAGASALYFTRYAANALELWSSDGSAGGTQLVSSWSSPLPTLLDAVVVGDSLLFELDLSGGAQPDGWWLSDGTAAGTQWVQGAGNGHWARSNGTRAYFTGFDFTFGNELWFTDGTVAGTQLAFDAQPNYNVSGLSSMPGVFLGAGNGFLYAARANQGQSYGEEPIYTDGTPGGSMVLADINPGFPSSHPRSFGAWQGQGFFLAQDPAFGYEMWTTDGTPAGTQLLIDLAPGPGHGEYEEDTPYLPAGPGLVFAAEGDAGVEPWISDGTSAGTGLLHNIQLDPLSGDSLPRELARLGDKVLFSAHDGVHGREPWVTDGSEAGTQLLGDLCDGCNSVPHSFTALGGVGLFSARTNTLGWPHNFELWRTDGTPQGTALLVEIHPDPTIGAGPAHLTRVGEVVYFAADDGSSGSELWRSDGTAAGTWRVADIEPGPNGSDPDELFEYAGQLYFTASTAADGRELWTSDGTAAGTQLAVDLEPGPGSWLLTDVAVSGGQLYFARSGSLLYRSDGTTAGTQLLKTFPQGVAGAPLKELTAFEDGLLFFANAGAIDVELWHSDGTSAGTQLVREIHTAGVHPGLHSLIAVGERAFFFDNRVGGQDLWVTDGTSAGTQLVQPFPGLQHADVPNLVLQPTSDGRVLFAGNDLVDGKEPWISDGSAAGTFLLADLNAGWPGSQPELGVRLGEWLILPADNALVGTELFRIPIGDTGGWVSEPLGAACAGTFGAPALDSSGTPTLGDPFVLELASAPPNSAALLLLDTQHLPLPSLGACAPLLPTPFSLAVVPTSAAGEAQLPLLVPNSPNLLGQDLYFQALAPEAGGPYLGLGVASALLEVVLGA